MAGWPTSSTRGMLPSGEMVAPATAGYRGWTKIETTLAGDDPRRRTGVRRGDIDGLRGLAILAVLLFHASPRALPGGFAGVDVFFVLSGYLITGLLDAEVRETGTIDVAAFWSRRVRRLAPALLFVLATLIVVCGVSLNRVSGDTGAFARAAIATLLLRANHFFLNESGDYFGLAAETNPLLHMWSLSVEEQFYLAWPVVFLLLSWRGRYVRSTRRVVVGIAVAAAASFVASTLWSATDPAQAFYLMPSRAWELLAGGLLAVAFAAHPITCGARRAAAVAAAGLGLIVASAALLTGDVMFPGPLAAMPVVGTLLLLSAGAAGPGNAISRGLGTPLLAYLGKISYPLYLWHWPFLVVSRSQRLYEPEAWRDAVWLGIAVVAAVFTFEVVERRGSTLLRRRTPAATIAWGVAGSAAVLSLAGLLGAWVLFGWGYSAKEQQLFAARQDLPAMNCIFPAGYPASTALDGCYPQSPLPSVLLWGDSHANHWRPALETASRGLNVNLATLTMVLCRPLPAPARDAHCSEFNEQVMDHLAGWRDTRHLAGIVLAGTWANGTGTLTPSVRGRAKERDGVFFDPRARSSDEALSYLEAGLLRVATRARDLGIRVLIVLPGPSQRFTAARCLAAKNGEDCSVSSDEVRAYTGPADRVIRGVADRFANVRAIDPVDFMCADGRCATVVDGLIAYTDEAHVSRTFSAASAARFASDLKWLSGPRP